MKRLIIALCAGALLAARATPVVAAGDPDPTALADRADPGLEADLQDRLATLGADARVAVIVRFISEGAPAGTAPPIGRSDRSRLIRTSRATAEKSQGRVKSALEQQQVGPLTVLWLINALAFEAEPAVIRRVAAQPEVVSVVLDRTVIAQDGAATVLHGTTAVPAGRAPASATGAAPMSPASGVAPAEWNIDMIGAPRLWAIGLTGAGVVVASMDSGVDVLHQDLRGRYRGGSNSWFDPNGEHASPYDRTGHGTQTTGLMVGGAAGGSAIGAAPGAMFIAVKMFDDSGAASFSRIHAGYQWLLDPDGDPDTDDAADVVNNSWGLLNGVNQCLTEFADDIRALRAAGIAVVFSAGNDGPSFSTSGSPANDTGSFATGAVDIGSNIGAFSSRGPSACDGSVYPEATAPGVDVLTSDLTFGGLFPDSYAVSSGTSFAAPHVSGGMALLEGAFPQATVAQIEAALRVSARDGGPEGPDNAYGAGIVDLVGAFDVLVSGALCTDADGDGHAGEGGVCGPADCDDGDDADWGAPGEARDLALLADGMTLNWREPEDSGGAMMALKYDTLRSDEPGGFAANGTCVESDGGPETTASDVLIPMIGAAFYYLVRAESRCPAGQGSLGHGSGGIERSGRACP